MSLGGNVDLVLGISLGLVKVFSGCFELSLETLDLGLAAQESIHTPVLATGKLSGEVRYKPCLLVIAEKLHSPVHGFAQSNRVAATTQHTPGKHIKANEDIPVRCGSSCENNSDDYA